MSVFKKYDLYTLRTHAAIVAEMEEDSFYHIMDCIHYIVEDQALSAWEQHEAGELN